MPEKLKGLDYVINLVKGSFNGAIAVKNVVGEVMDGFDTIKGAVDDLVQVRSQFQGFEALLGNALGGIKGAKTFGEIKKYATETPVSVDEISNSFLKLQNSGFNPTMEKIGQLGDIAASKAKSLGQLTDAVVSAQSGEFANLKEFGVNAVKNGDDVTFTYEGISKTMKFSKDATEDYLLGLAKMPGIQGSMAEMAGTYTGQQDIVNNKMLDFKNGLAIELKPVLDWYMGTQGSIIELMQSTVNVIKSVIGWVKNNADIFVALGIAIAGVGIAYLMSNPPIVASTLAMVAHNAELLVGHAKTGLLTIAQWDLNAAFNANPVGFVIAGIAILAAGFYLAYQKSETFRAVIGGIIEVGKLLGSVFMAVGKTIIGALTFDKKMFVSGIMETAGLVENILGGGVQKAFNKGFDTSKAKSKADAAKEKAEADKQKAEAEKQKTSLTTMDTLTGKPTLPKAKNLGTVPSGKNTSTDVSSNKQVRNVNVTIGKLVEQLTVSTTNLQGTGMADIKRIITEVLTGAVHDSEIALSNG